MKNLFIYAVFLICCGIHTANAQQSTIYTHKSSAFENALQWYQNKQYQAAQEMFKTVYSQADNITTKADCAYYIAHCAIRLQQHKAETLMKNFVKQYPGSRKKNIAFVEVGDYYFDHGRYPQALQWYTLANIEAMEPEKAERFSFRKGYTLFSAGQYAKAEPYLNRVSNTEKYTRDASYYLGYIAYKANDYKKANAYFSIISNDATLNEKLSYYQADMNFKLGDFQQAIDFGKKQLLTATSKEESQLHKIIGESYFNLQRYKEAIPHLKKYKGKLGKWTHVDLYQLGYAYYQQKAYKDAIDQFNKIINGKDEIAQNAYYHLAECYLKTDRKQEALNAFKNASQLNFNTEIQQDAWLNYARLSYDIGNPYQSVPQVLKTYLEKYPDSGYKEEIKELLIAAYITSKNYDEALQFLKDEKSYTSKKAYQKVAFYRGLELFNDQEYNQAISYFKTSLQQPHNAFIVTRATYWVAESYYELKNYDQALLAYKTVAQYPATEEIPEYRNLYYAIAYSYFNQKAYDQAIPQFHTYIKNETNDKERIQDSYLRLGDSYFATANYPTAIENYDNAIALPGVHKDHGYFQKAISYGFLNKKEKKAAILRTLIHHIPASPLRDDALYELGNTYVADNKPEMGITTYRQLAKEYKTSPYRIKALLKEGLIHYNIGQNDNALTVFKQIVNDFPKTQEALQAVETVKRIYIDLNDVEAYARWVKSIDFIHVDNADLDHATFEAADKQWLQNKGDAAIKALKSYLKQFPEGLHSLKVHFYLAQSYTNHAERSEAIPHYIYIINSKPNEYTEQALAMLGKLYMENNTYDKAIPILKQLEKETRIAQNSSFAQSNLMKAYYKLQKYTETLTYAEKVIANTTTDINIKNDAYMMIARTAMKTGDQDKAKSAYTQVQQTATGALAAEALYYEAYFNHKERKFKAANVAVQKLAREYPQHKVFGAKGLLIMAKSFYAMDDAFQATYILENIITNFTQYPEIVAEAKAIRSHLNIAEAKRNSSIDIRNNN